MQWQRPLTGMERWRWLFDRAAPMNLVLVARTAGRLNEAKLRDALDAIVERYPAFTARIAPAARPTFESTPQQLPLVIEPWGEDDWRAAAVHECNTRADTVHGPLVRARLLNGDRHADLLLTYNQSVADALSGAHLIDELLTVYGGGARPAVRSPEMLAPPLASVFGNRFAARKEGWLERLRTRRLTPFGGIEAAAPAARRTALIEVQRPASQVDALGAKAASHGSSVHGALAAALLLSIGDELRGEDLRSVDNIGIATSVDVRRHTSFSSEAVGNLLTRVVSTHRIHYDTLFWDLAAEVSSQLRAAVSSGKAFVYAQLAETSSVAAGDSAAARQVARFERHNRVAAVINNIGRQDFYCHFGDVELKCLRVLASANANVGAAMVLSTVTLGDTASLCFTFAEPLVSAERAQRVVNGMLRVLDQRAF